MGLGTQQDLAHCLAGLGASRFTHHNDLTNAFKAYRRNVILECGPYSSSHFNLTIEMSLSALIRRYQIAEIPINWYGRTWGGSSLRLTQMGRRYLSVLLKLFFERLLVADDILEERLMERASASGRLDTVERRVTELEKALSDVATPREARAGETRPKRESP